MRPADGDGIEELDAFNYPHAYLPASQLDSLDLLAADGAPARGYLADLEHHPVSGGIGIAEFGLDVGLTSARMTASAATVLVYRLSTFYFPPLWGFASFKWLLRNKYI